MISSKHALICIGGSYTNKSMFGSLFTGSLGTTIKQAHEETHKGRIDGPTEGPTNGHTIRK